MDSIKVLMVDDESRMRKLVKDFLTREGYMVLEAGDGEQALDIFMNDKNISLVILDVMMPKMDGWETLKEIESSHRFRLSCLPRRQMSTMSFRALIWE